jgi:anti-sigma regulatory factor (Ser/Thr protein kinase)
VCRVAKAEFNADESAAAQARHFVTQWLQCWELAALADVAALLTSELVTNAVIHARSGPVVVLTVADGIIEVGVTDNDRQLPPVPSPNAKTIEASHKLPNATATGGRGLYLVNTLAHESGTVTLAAGKQVWFRLDANNWSYRSACTCHGENLDLVRLDSGRYALAIAGPWDST